MIDQIIRKAEGEFFKENIKWGEIPEDTASDVLFAYSQTLRAACEEVRRETIEEAIKAMGEEKFSNQGTPFCRNCNHAMVKSTGTGTPIFPWQCPNCNNYQEDLDDRSSGYNQHRSEALTKLKEIKGKII